MLSEHLLCMSIQNVKAICVGHPAGYDDQLNEHFKPSQCHWQWRIQDFLMGPSSPIFCHFFEEQHI